MKTYIIRRLCNYSFYKIIERTGHDISLDKVVFKGSIIACKAWLDLKSKHKMEKY